jgi:hypothetical protein
MVRIESTTAAATNNVANTGADAAANVAVPVLSPASTVVRILHDLRC